MEHGSSFGHWLRERRKALDLTQLDLAIKIGCAETTVQKMEGDLRRPSKQVAQLMAEVLDVPLDDRPAFVTFARSSAAGPASKSDRVGAGTSPLPMPLTSLLGRDKELAAIKDRITNKGTRLLTLTGPPGIGKTRLSLEIASDLRHSYKDGVKFVALAPLSDPDLVQATIAHDLGVTAIAAQPMQAALVQYLQDRHILLVLDNFEQIVSAAPAVAGLLTACPGLQVLVTSREALSVRGEQQFAVGPLAVPREASDIAQDDLLSYPSVALFVERAQAMRDFDPSEENLRAVAAICDRLDGLPLAIELAAARSKLFSPGALLARLGAAEVPSTEYRVPSGSVHSALGTGSRDLPDRHQTLHHAIAWSYDLLNKSEQALFARLGIFSGGSTLPEVEAICNARGDLGMDVLEGVTSLVDKSLLQVRNDGGATNIPHSALHTPHSEDVRFSMLEMIREYALEKLEERGEANDVSGYHAEYYLALAEAAEPELSGPKQIDWLRRLESEQDNLRAALGRSYKHGDLETVLRLGGAIWRFWWVNKHVSEGRRWLEGALFQDEGRRTNDESSQARPKMQKEKEPSAYVLRPSSPYRAKALGAAGKLAWEQADYEQSATYLRESLALYREMGDERTLASALNSLGVPLVDLCEYGEARTLFEESLVLADRLQEKAGIALALANLGNLAGYQGKWEQAAELHTQSLEIRRQLDDKWHMIHSLRDLGRVEGVLGYLSHAVSLYEEAIILCRQVGDEAGLALSLKDLGLLTVSDQNYAQVMALCKESLAKCRELSARSGVAEVLCDIGRLAISRGDYGEAENALKNSLVLYQELNRKRESLQCLAGLAEVYAEKGEWDRALRLMVAADILAEKLTTPLLPRDRLAFDRSYANAEAHLEDSARKAAQAEGVALAQGGRELTRAIAYALEELPGK